MNGIVIVKGLCKQEEERLVNLMLNKQTKELRPQVIYLFFLQRQSVINVKFSPEQCS